jgi:amino acid permease
VPYALIHTGIPAGIAVNIAMCGICFYSGYLYLLAKKMSPTKVDSLYELGFLTLGKCSIYLISITVLISLFGCMMIYFIIFGDISASIVRQQIYPNEENYFTTRMVYVVLLAVLMIPFVI